MPTAELPAEIADVDTDQRSSPDSGRSPRHLKELLRAEHLTGMTHQHLHCTTAKLDIKSTGAILTRRYELPIAPVILGVILGRVMEIQVAARALVASGGDWGVFVERR